MDVIIGEDALADFCFTLRNENFNCICDTQAPGWFVLLKTKPTDQEKAGIPIWSPLDTCSACAACAQRYFPPIGGFLYQPGHWILCHKCPISSLSQGM